MHAPNLEISLRCALCLAQAHARAERCAGHWHHFYAASSARCGVNNAPRHANARLRAGAVRAGLRRAAPLIACALHRLHVFPIALAVVLLFQTLIISALAGGRLLRCVLAAILCMADSSTRH